MSTDRDVERIVRSWMDEGVTALPDRVLDLVLDQIPATPQRRASWLARRFPLMNNNFVRVALVAVALVLAVIIGAKLLPGPDVGPSPSDTATPTPTGTPEPSLVPFSSTSTTGAFDPGSIVLDGDFPLAIVFDVPAGWSREGSPEAADLVGVHKIRGPVTPVYASWAVIANVYADPCHASPGPIDPPIGPAVDDLVTAMTSMVGFESTNPTEVTVDGFAGKHFELSSNINPAADGCDDPVWLSLWEPASGSETARVPGATTMQFWVVDVNGTRLVMFTEEYNATPAEIAGAVAIMDSVRFQ